MDVSKATAGTLATGRGGTGRTDGKVTALATTRYLDGVGFTGAADVVHYGTCSTEAATVEKVVACSNYALKTGGRIIVRFTVTNTAASPTLNVNRTGAKNIRYRNSNISAGYLAANRTYEFVYDGSYYQVVGDIDTNTKYSKASNAEAIAGTNDTKYMTPLRVKEAVAKFAPVKTVNGNSPNSDGNVTLNVSMDPLVAYPVGSIYMSVNSTNPSQLFGGTWVALNEGRVLIGAGTAYPAGSTGGEATHKLTTKEMPSHSHSGVASSNGGHRHTINVWTIGGGGGTGWLVNFGSPQDVVNENGSHSHSVSIDSTGGGAAHNNMPPYLSVYMWKRTA